MLDQQGSCLYYYRFLSIINPGQQMILQFPAQVNRLDSCGSLAE
jgi:hypothetical protein